MRMDALHSFAFVIHDIVLNYQYATFQLVGSISIFHIGQALKSGDFDGLQTF